MKTFYGNFPRMSFLAAVLALSAILAACSGGGGSVSVISTGGSASASISISSSAAYPAGTTFSASTSTASAVDAPLAASAVFDNVWVTVTRIALIPTTGPEFPDRDGEIEEQNDPSENGRGGKPGFFTVVLDAPATFDLLNPPSRTDLAKIANRIAAIPAGNYSKIRVYYESVVGRKPDGTLIPFRQTANYHFDVHFVGGNLVVPVSTDPKGGIGFYSIYIEIVGLKIQNPGNGDKYLMRPQVFATVDPVKYIVSGKARNVDPEAGTFDIRTPGGTTVPALFREGTAWRYVDLAVPGTAWGSVGAFLGSKGLRDTAEVEVIGEFLSGNVLDAEEVDVAFPASRDGKVYLGWKPDNTFSLRATPDNVIPKPSRTTAYYDNSAAASSYPRLPEGDLAIVDNAVVTARGYAVAGGIEAFWISVYATGP